MRIKYNLNEMEKVITNLSELLGISTIVLDTDGNCLATHSDQNDYCSFLQASPRFKTMCEKSDYALFEKCKMSKKIESCICHAGLCDIVMPIIKENIVAAYVILGRIRLASFDKKTGYTKKHEKSEELYNKITLFSEKQLNNLTELLPRIMFESAIIIEPDSIIEDISNFIRSNLADNLSTKILCEKFYISKNSLYKAFAEKYGCTVNDYIVSLRMDEAKKLLLNTQKSVMEVAENVGITNYTYFCKLFKKKNGISAFKYKKINQQIGDKN